MENKRVALLVSSNAPDLNGGLNDLSSAFHIFKKSTIGNCDSKKSSYLLNCKSRNYFNDWIYKNLNCWDPADQLVFYYSGHGVMVDKEFAFTFIDEDNNTTFILFTNFINELTYLHKVKNVLFIIDACHSGAITNSDLSKTTNKELVLPLEVPKGVAYISSSSSEMQRSYENAKTNLSVFTELFIEGLDSGLDGKPTHNGLIGIEDIVSYINEKLQDEEYSQYNQKAKAKIGNFTDYFWVAKNISGTIEKENKTVESFELIEIDEYNRKIPFLERGVPECDIEDLNIELIKGCYLKQFEQDAEIDNILFLLKKLNLIREIRGYEKPILKVYSIICFHDRPETYFPMLRTRITRKNGARTTIVGNISTQIARILEFTNEDLQFSLLDVKGQLHESTFQSSEGFAVVRELLSNAFAHRDYEKDSSIKVVLKENSITISNPGEIYVSWDNLLTNAYDNISKPVNIHVNEIMYNLGLFEGFGRGLLSVKRFIELFGDKAITFKKNINEDISITVNTTNSIFRPPNETEAFVDSTYTVLKNDIVVIADPSPIIILFGAAASGKTMTLIRLTRYLIQHGYKVSPERTFRDSKDSHYQNMCDDFASIMNSTKVPARNQAIDFMLVKVMDKSGRPICQLLEAPGAHYFNPNEPRRSFPSYINMISQSNNRKTWLFILEKDWMSQQDRNNFVQKITDLQQQYIRTTDKVIFTCHKADLHGHYMTSGKYNVPLFFNDIENQYPGIFWRFKNTNPITKFWRNYNFDFVVFSAGAFIDDGEGHRNFIPSSDENPEALWEAILKTIRG